MDRRVIVLTPAEWNKREELAVFAEQSHQFNHYNKDNQLVIKSMVSLATRSIEEGNIKEGLAHLQEITNVCEKIYNNSCKAQEGITDLLSLVKSLEEDWAMNGFYIKHKEFAGKTYDELHAILDDEIKKEEIEVGSSNKALAIKAMEEMEARL